MPSTRSKLREIDILAAMVDGYAPALRSALEGVSPKVVDAKTCELRELLAVWDEIRTHLASGQGI